MIYYIYNKTKTKELFIMMDINYIEKMAQKEKEMENLGIESDSLSTEEIKFDKEIIDKVYYTLFKEK